MTALLSPVEPKFSLLAFTFQAQGKLSECEPLYQRCITIREKAQGPDHPDLATNLNNLAELLRVSGSTTRARC